MKKKFTLIFVAINTTTKEVSMTLSYLQLLIQSGVYLFYFFFKVFEQCGRRHEHKNLQAVLHDGGISLYVQCTHNRHTLYLVCTHIHTRNIHKRFSFGFFCTNKSKNFYLLKRRPGKDQIICYMFLFKNYIIWKLFSSTWIIWEEKTITFFDYWS